MISVAYDFDDVCIDFVGGFLRAITAETGQQYSIDDIEFDGESLETWAAQVLNLSPDNSFGWLDWFGEHIEYWYGADTEPDLLPTLDKLSQRGYRLELVTTKPRWAWPVVWEWLYRNDPPFETVHLINGFVKHEASSANVLVDDRSTIIRAWEDSRSSRLGILYARPHNMSTREGLTVAYNHREVLGILERRHID